MTRRDRMPRRHRISGSGKSTAPFDTPAQRRFRRLGLEKLEDRRLLAITQSFDSATGALVIQSDADDQITVSANDQGTVTVNGLPVEAAGQSLAATAVRSLAVIGGPGSNLINLSLKSSKKVQWLDVDLYKNLSAPAYAFGGDGNDTLNASDSSSSIPVELHGGPGDDSLISGRGVSSLFGEEGDDRLAFRESTGLRIGELGSTEHRADGGPGVDVFLGDSREDRQDLISDARGDGIWIPVTIERNVLLNAITEENFEVVETIHHFGAVKLKSMEAADLSCLSECTIDARKFSGTVTLRASSDDGANLYGGPNNDFLYGSRTVDHLDGGPGSDLLDGGDGEDTYWFEDATAGPEYDTLVESSSLGGKNELDFHNLQIPLSSSLCAIRVDLREQEIAQMENRFVVTSSPQSFTDVSGFSHGPNCIHGNARDNRIWGGDSDDDLFGHEGNDELNGGSGDDRLDGGDGHDKLLGDSGNNLLVGGDGDDYLEGALGNDTLHGGSGNDQLWGSWGNDRLFGGSGNDKLWGEAGADLFISGGGHDETDAEADLAVLALGPNTATLGPGNASVGVTYSALVASNGPDYANNVILNSAWSGAVGRSPVVSPMGVEVVDPVTQQSTGIRVLAPGFAATETNVASATIPGRGTYVASVSMGVPYVRDPATVNNRSQVETQVAGDFLLAGLKTLLKTKNAAGTKTGNAEVKGLDRYGVSADGAAIAFYSFATDYDTIPPANITGPQHVYYGDPVMVDVTPDGQNSGNNVAMSPSLSADGRYVAFASGASNLVAGVTDGNSTTDVFVRDMVAGVTRLVSASTAGSAAANAASESPKISGDGRFVVFRSQATDLVAGFPAGTTTWQVYRANLQTGAVQLVSVNAAGNGPANGDSVTPLVNHDGRYVAWRSGATDLAAGVTDANLLDDLFVRDMTAGTTALVTINHPRTGTANGPLAGPVDLTPDGAFLAYASSATDLVNLADPLAATSDVFVYDVRQGTNRLASISSDGTSAGDRNSSSPVLSADGRYVAFESQAGNLVAGNWGQSVRVFVRDLTQGVTEFGAVTTDGTSPATAMSPSLSGDGRYLAFASWAGDLVAGFADGNGGASDVYVRDRQTGKTTLISVNTDGTASGNGVSQRPLLSRDGQVVHFFSEATDLVANILDENGAADLFSSNRHVAVPDTALRYTAPAGGPNRVTLRQNGANLEIVNDADARVLASKPLLTTTIVVVTGADAADDQLTVDLAAGGFFSLPGGVSFSGGAAGHDTLVLRGSVTAVRYDATGPDAGFVTAEIGTNSLPIAYTGLEPIVDEATAADRFFTSWLSGNPQIRLTDDADPNNGRMILDAHGTGAFESIAFPNPTRLLSLAGGGGNDTVSVVSLDNGFASQLLWLAGGAGSDVLDASALSRAVTLDGGPGDDTLRGGSGNTRYDVTPGSRDVLHDSGGTDTLAFSGAFAPVTVDLDLQGADQTIDGGGNQLQINGQIENFIGGVYADVVWAAPLAVPRDVRAGAALSGQTVYDQLRVRTHDPGAGNSGFNISVPGFDMIKTAGTFLGVSMWLPPVAVDDNVAAQIGTALTIPVAANDTDPENDPRAVSAITQPASGTAELNGDGTVTYSPAAGFFGEDRFTYTIQDPLRGSDTATVYVTVNRPPDAVDDAVTNTIVTVDVLANDTDPDGDPLSVTAITQPAAGTAVLNAGGTITYTPPPGFQGTALIPYAVSDGQGGTDAATLTVTVRPVNDPPSFTAGANQTVNANAGPQTVAGWATNISAGPADEAGQTVEFFAANDNAALFAVPPAIAANGTLTYTPAVGANGTAVVFVLALDDGGTVDSGSDASAFAVFAITVVAPGDIELTGFGTAAGALSQLQLTYEIRGSAVPPFAFAFYTSANARFDAADTERGPRVSVTDPTLLAVGTHTVTVSGADYEAFLLDPAVPFFLAVADAGQAIPDETNETNNDLNFMGLYHRPASPAPLLIRGGDDTDRRVDEAADTIELTGGTALSVTSRFTAQPLSVPWADVASVRVVTAGGADTIRGDAATIPLLQIEGGTGSDSVIVLGGGVVCDLMGGVMPRVRGVELLDIGGSGANRLVLRQTQVLAADSGVLHVRAGSDDAVDFGSGWTLAAPQYIGGEFFNVLGQGGASLRLTGPHPWQNPVNAFDVNNVDQVTAQDVLLVINLINAQSTGPLPVPPPVHNCPPHWYDVDGDDHVAAVDVLLVINWINGQMAASLAGSGEGEQRSADEGKDADRAWAEPFQEAVRQVQSVTESGVERSVSTTCRRRTPASLTWPTPPDTQTTRAFRARWGSDFVATSTDDDWERSVTDWFQEFGGEAPAEWSAGF